MWVWDFSIVFFQCVPDDKMNIRRIFVFAVINPIDPKFNGKVDAQIRAVRNPVEMDRLGPLGIWK